MDQPAEGQTAPAQMGLSESGIGNLASRIAADFARSGRRAQTLSPGAQDEPSHAARASDSVGEPPFRMLSACFATLLSALRSVLMLLVLCWVLRNSTTVSNKG